MRKLVYGINVTIDGCCDHTKGKPNPEVHEYFTRLMRESEVLVYGRKTYELMFPFWPEIAKNPSKNTTDVDEFAQAFNTIPRIFVFSKSLDGEQGEKTTVLRGNIKQEILKLKQESGKDISVGGVDFPSQLFQLGLVDEVHIVVHPVIAGKGRRLFNEIDLQESLEFILAESKIFNSGHMALHYKKL